MCGINKTKYRQWNWRILDASFDQDLLRGTAAAALRDHKGNFIAEGKWRLDWCTYALTDEVLALRFGLSRAQRTGCSRLVINSGNLEVIKIMKSGGTYAEAAAVIFYDCYHLARDFSFTSLNIVIGKRIK